MSAPLATERRPIIMPLVEFRPAVTSINKSSRSSWQLSQAYLHLSCPWRHLSKPMSPRITDSMCLRRLVAHFNCQFHRSVESNSSRQTSDKSIVRICFSWHQWRHRWEATLPSSAVSQWESAPMRPSATSVSESASAKLTIDPNKKTE